MKNFIQLLCLISFTFACTAQQRPATTEIIKFNSGGVVLEGELNLPSVKKKFPLVVFVHGSGRATRMDYEQLVNPFLQKGIAVFRYDKRGVGKSAGVYEEVNVGTENSSITIPTLARDAAAALQFLKRHTKIDSSRCFYVGGSQAGWIIPVAAGLKSVRGTVIFSGPTVTVGEEIYYSTLAETGNFSVVDANEKVLTYAGNKGFDPIPFVRKLNKPSFWIFGGEDESIPVDRSLKLLNQVRDDFHLPIVIQIFPGANHGMRFKEGTKADYINSIVNWIVRQVK